MRRQTVTPSMTQPHGWLRREVPQGRCMPNRIRRRTSCDPQHQISASLIPSVSLALLELWGLCRVVRLPETISRTINTEYHLDN